MFLFTWCLEDCFESCACPVSSCLGCLPSWPPQQSVQLNCVSLCVTAITKGPLPHTGKLWNMYFPKVPLMVFSIYHPCFPKDLCGNKIPLLTRFILLPNYIGDAAQSAAQVMSRIHHHKSCWLEERAGHSMTNRAFTHKHSCNKSAMTRKVVRRRLQLLWLSEGLWTSSWGSPMSHQLFRKFWCHTTRTVPVQG